MGLRPITDVLPVASTFIRYAHSLTQVYNLGATGECEGKAA